MANTEPQSTFFNVMPEVVNAKPAPAPTPRKVNSAGADKIFGTTPAAPTVINMPPKKRSFFRLKRILIPLTIMVLGIIGLAVWFFMFSKDDDNKSTNTNTQTQEPAPVAEVTTSSEFLARYFGADTCTNLNKCGDKADPDHDGLSNKEEFDTVTDPNNPDSDGDGLADGDEKLIFGSDPLISRTFRDGTFNDADFVKGGFAIKTNTPYTQSEIAEIKSKIKELGLHQPTLTTIGRVALSLYDFKDPNATALDNLNIDQSPQAKLDRDTQRQSTIKKIGGALLKYKTAKKTFPLSPDFISMSEEISTFNTIATNYSDPINTEKYVYGYTPSANGLDFTLTYFSETQNQLIKYTAKNAEEAAAKEAAQRNDEQRISDLENIKSALLIYSSANVDSNSEQINVFPTKEQYPAALIPRYISAVPKDPNGAEYVYTSNAPYDNFTLKAVFQAPSSGVTGYMCTQEGCKNY
jgi:hypothetical protein